MSNTIARGRILGGAGPAGASAARASDGDEEPCGRCPWCALPVCSRSCAPRAVIARASPRYRASDAADSAGARVPAVGGFGGGASRVAGGSEFGYAPPRDPRLMSVPARVYIASPLGFSQAGRHFHDAVLLPFVRGLGYEVLDPWALTDPRPDRRGAGDAVRRRAARGVAARSTERSGATNRAAIDGARRGRRRARRRRRRQRHRRGDRLRVRARQADRGLSRRLPAERGQRGRHRERCRWSTSSARAAAPSWSATRTWRRAWSRCAPRRWAGRRA